MKKEVETNLKNSRIIVNTAKAKEILAGLDLDDDTINLVVSDDDPNYHKYWIFLSLYHNYHIQSSFHQKAHPRLRSQGSIRWICPFQTKNLYDIADCLL